MPHPANIFRTHHQRLTYWLGQWMIAKSQLIGISAGNHRLTMHLISIKIEIYDRREDLGYGTTGYRKGRDPVPNAILPTKDETKE